jgi:alkanesulfonate monooxygenase
MEFLPVHVYSTAPESSRYADGSDVIEAIDEFGSWCDASGVTGARVYTDNRLIDPWLAAQRLIMSSQVHPLVAVQPVYMHPYSVAKMVASLTWLYDRRVDMNFVAGGFRGDLLALGDQTHHDDRYERLIEYADIVLGLLKGEAVTFGGAHHRVMNLRLRMEVPEALQPHLTLAGSSPAGLAAANRLGAVPVQYPSPDYDPAALTGSHGVRVGLITGASAGEAWEEAHRRFPDDPEGARLHAMAMKMSDSDWHRAIAQSRGRGGPYWYGPFERHQSFCPYLVGSVDDVASELRRLAAGGVDTFILDIPESGEDLRAAVKTFAAAGLDIVR